MCGLFRKNCNVIFVFFFRQETAYEIKECDWSSDVCSSDLEVFIPDRAQTLDTSDYNDDTTRQPF